MPNTYYNSSYTGLQIDASVAKYFAIEGDGGAASKNWVNTQLLNYLTTTDASSTYLTQSNASSTYLSKSDASTTYATIHSHPYLPLAGGIMTGTLSFNGNDSLPQFSGSPPHYLGIEAFASGGTMKWKAAADCSVGFASKSRCVVGDNDAQNPGGALLLSGPGRSDASPAGDTWLFFDQCSATTSAWGIKHAQANNRIEFYKAGSVITYIDMNNGWMNTNGAYGFVRGPAGYTFDASTTTRTLSLSITSHGRPVFIICSGDLNPTTADNAWMTISLIRDSTTLCYQICEIHGNSWNNPFCCCYLDVVGAGTRTYKVTFGRGAGTFTLTENGAVQGPNFCAFEI